MSHDDLIASAMMTTSNQRAKQGCLSLEPLIIHLWSTNPSTKNLQDQNASADVAQTNTSNRIHLVTLVNDWTSRTLHHLSKPFPG